MGEELVGGAAFSLAMLPKDVAQKHGQARIAILSGFGEPPEGIRRHIKEGELLIASGCRHADFPRSEETPVEAW